MVQYTRSMFFLLGASPFTAVESSNGTVLVEDKQDMQLSGVLLSNNDSNPNYSATYNPSVYIV